MDKKQTLSKKKVQIAEKGPSVAPGAEPDKTSTKESIRSKIGLFYVQAFVIIIGLVLIYMLLVKYSVTEIKDVLLAISGILSGPLGFIIGFYFKEELQNTNNV